MSSSLVKEVAAYGGDVSGLVPAEVRHRLAELPSIAPTTAPAAATANPEGGAEMDVQEKLAQIIQVVEDARAMPMSASCLVNREEMLGELDELRSLLPEQLQQADVLLSDRDAVVEGGRDAAQRLLDQARAEHDRLVEDQAVVVGARERAAIVLAEANAESTRLLSDADDYVDRKLAEFEIALQKLTQQVVRGRARLGARRAADLGRLTHDEPDPLDGQNDDVRHEGKTLRSRPRRRRRPARQSRAVARRDVRRWAPRHRRRGSRGPADGSATQDEETPRPSPEAEAGRVRRLSTRSRFGSGRSAQVTFPVGLDIGAVVSMPVNQPAPHSTCAPR